MKIKSDSLPCQKCKKNISMYPYLIMADNGIWYHYHFTCFLEKYEGKYQESKKMELVK